jgi:hypothetical protein
LIYFPSLSYSTVVVTIKTSILISYYRIFGHVLRTRYFIYVLLAASWAWGIANFFALLFQCTPIDKAWHPEKPGHCIQFIPFLWGTSITNFIIDWLILAVPIAPVLKLRLPRTQKILVGLSFLCGSLACIASTVRSAKTAEFDPTDLGSTLSTIPQTSAQLRLTWLQLRTTKLQYGSSLSPRWPSYPAASRSSAGFSVREPCKASEGSETT